MCYLCRPCVLNPHVRIPEGLMEQDVPSPHLPKLVVTVSVAACLVVKAHRVCICVNLCERDRTEGEALARLLLLPAIWTRSATANPNISPNVVRVWV